MDALGIAQKQVVTAHVEHSVENLIERLNKAKISFVPILDSNGKLFGVVSRKDLLGLNLKDKATRAMKAWEICSHKVHTIQKGMSVLKAAELMIEKQIHHLLVVEGDAIKGVISSHDILRALGNAAQVLADQMVEDYCW